MTAWIDALPPTVFWPALVALWFSWCVAALLIARAFGALARFGRGGRS